MARRSELGVSHRSRVASMISVDRFEKDSIKKEFPDAYVGRTMIQDTKRQNYWATLDGRVAKHLANLRRVSVDEIYKSENR